MPLWETSWWPKAALNCGSCSLGWVGVSRSREEFEGDVEGAGGAVRPVRPVWGSADRAAVGCSAAECVLEGGVERDVERR